eukprot:jgi/Ulvmu1/11962/UM082_0041.1
MHVRTRVEARTAVTHTWRQHAATRGDSMQQHVETACSNTWRQHAAACGTIELTPGRQPRTPATLLALYSASIDCGMSERLHNVAVLAWRLLGPPASTRRQAAVTARSGLWHSKSRNGVWKVENDGAAAWSTCAGPGKVIIVMFIIDNSV